MLTKKTNKIHKRKDIKSNSNKGIYVPLMNVNRSSCLISPVIDNTDAILVKKQQKSNLINQHLISSISTSVFKQREQQLTDINFTRRQHSLHINNGYRLSSSKEQKDLTVNPRTIINYNPKFAKERVSPNKFNRMSDKHIYYFLTLLGAYCALSLTTVQFVLADSALQASMQKFKVSPDIISIPSYVETIRVKLNSNIVKPGDKVPAKNFEDLKEISWEASNPDASHTLLLLDLDRRSGVNNTQSIYNQFTSINVPGSIVSKGQTIVQIYTPSVPCRPSSEHRILMLAFHQEQNIDLSDITYMSSPHGHSSKRENFKLQDFIKRHRLSLVAANIFLALGDTNGTCNSSMTLHSIQNVSSILIAMVIALTVYTFSSRRSLLN